MDDKQTSQEPWTPASDDDLPLLTGPDLAEALVDEPSSRIGSEVLTIVPAPRPYAYRKPVGHPEAEDMTHPLRRRSDFDPQK